MWGRQAPATEAETLSVLAPTRYGDGLLRRSFDSCSPGERRYPRRVPAVRDDGLAYIDRGVPSHTLKW